jgi:voltage-gated potassium channel
LLPATGIIMTIRKRTAELLQANRPGDTPSRIIDLILIVLILLTVVAVMAESVQDLGAPQQLLLWYFEVISVGVFTLEYVLRLWSCPDREDKNYTDDLKGRLRWMVSPFGIIDLLAILPFYIALFYLGSSEESLLLLRVIRGVRLLRIFKLTRYTPAFQIMYSVLKLEAASLMVGGFFLLIFMVMASWGIYLLENDIQPDVFGDIPSAMWWAIVSLTTVGYGDVVPQTTGGKFFAGFIALVGVGMVALPAGILASGFSAEVQRRAHAYNRALDAALSDGIISMKEAEYLEGLREQLGLGIEEAADLLKDAEMQHLSDTNCPHCGKKI